MSTDFGLYCLDCRDHIIIDNMRSPETCKALIRYSTTLKELYAMREDPESPLEIEVFACYSLHLDLSWFHLHAGHRQTVVDEYGREWPTCNTRFRKEGAKYEASCDLRELHEGEHSDVSPLKWW